MYRNTFIKLLFVFFLCGISRATALYNKREAEMDKEEYESEINIFNCKLGATDKDSWLERMDGVIAAMKSNSIRMNTFFTLQGASADQAEDISVRLNGDDKTSPWTYVGADAGVPIFYNSSEWGFVNGTSQTFRSPHPPPWAAAFSTGLFINKMDESEIIIVNAHADAESEEEQKMATKYILGKVSPLKPYPPWMIAGNLDYSTISKILPSIRTDGSIRADNSIRTDGSIRADNSITAGNIVFAVGDGIAVSAYESVDNKSDDGIVFSEDKPSIVTIKIRRDW
ncbi:uncharacterized protein J8A68_001190 [[Candida] subhashii]|uniref:Uncharacterized protein n=1 Tax=[Candida] subhashii TaxID=561895 RepID=A0A8J5V4J0_9ASCO|nr:uncharacterized protein J8A68_001190 [[Candida] subhashii]KAG7665134.1 hypothetical protein J8A68_001190 [[Candida] subhashii]